MRYLAIVIIVLIPMLQACRSTPTVLMPPASLADEKYLPDELLPLLQDLIDADTVARWVIDDGVTEIVRNAETLDERRAVVMYLIYTAPQHHYDSMSIEVITFPSQEGELDQLLVLLARRIGIDLNWIGYSEGHSNSIFEFSRGLTRSEMAWYCDWILTNYPDEIQWARAHTGISFGPDMHAEGIGLTL